jgi:hypothetical protein
VIQLPLIAARPRSVQPYTEEIESAGFEFVEWNLEGNSFGISFTVRKPNQ